ncbi:hypothetical protein GWI72_04745 [Microvirga tunisiensis]|uniref:Uncharacterized protein n=1 Tax=Pannonibacter tanglangensis TaxID=2750084 RepID=A0A7X5F0L3_9HYPH|nr:hypothetical protein [Pannonibacter sp. XCT-53]NBN77573.1 hypothetical protein [Pannonibacter sp. XCT-53]
MDVSVWTYAWDMLDLGVEHVTGELAALAGATHLSLAAAYHAGRFIQPRSSRRKIFFPEDGTVYYAPDAGLWQEAEITPRQAAVSRDSDLMARLGAAQSGGGLGLSAWTVCLHNTRLATTHAGHAMATAFGDRLAFALCPSSPAARAYVRKLVQEISHRFRPARIELETPGFLEVEHGFHHEKDGVGLTADEAFLMSVCFCPHCLERARAAGVDGEAARRAVVEILCDACERSTPVSRFPEFPETGLEAFRAVPALHDYLLWRREPVMSLIADARDAAHPDTAILLVDGPSAWRGGVDLDRVSSVCDGMILCLYGQTPETTAREIAAMRRRLGASASLILGLSAFQSAVASAEPLCRAAIAGAQAGADGLNYYNYGLVTRPRLGWMGEATAAFRAARTG